MDTVAIGEMELPMQMDDMGLMVTFGFPFKKKLSLNCAEIQPDAKANWLSVII